MAGSHGRRHFDFAHHFDFNHFCRHLLLLPWLGLMGAAILILLTFAISFVISLADYSALAACLG